MLALGCRRPPPAVARPLALAVEMSGCAAVARGRVCVVSDDGTLRLLVHAVRDAAFTSDDGPIVADPLATFDDARLYRLHPPRGTQKVRVAARVEADGSIADAEATVDIRWDPAPKWYAEARALANQGKSDEALALVREHAGSSDDGEAAIAIGQAARFEIMRNHVDESVKLFREAIAKDRRAGRVSGTVDDAIGLAFALSQRSFRYAEARAALDSVQDLLGDYPDGRALEVYHRAQIVSETGNRREALRQFHDAYRLATRLGMTRLARVVRTMTASQLDRFGRLEEALAIRRALDRELEGGPEACDRLALRSGMGFGLLLLSIGVGGNVGVGVGVGGDRVREATEVLERARGETACAESYLHAVTLGNLAFAKLLGGRPDDAASLLAAARARVPEAPLSESFFWLDLDGRIALARGDAARALAIYDQMDRRAAAALLSGYEWSALAGRGRALEALGRKRDALVAYEAAEGRLDDASLAIPIGEGRARFLVEREQSATSGIALLVSSGKKADALLWARRGRHRVLAGLEASRRVARLGAGDRARWDDAAFRYARERAAIDEEAARDWKLAIAELGPVQGERRSREVALRAALEELLSVLASGDQARPSAPTFAPAPLEPGELILLFHAAALGWTGIAADASGVTTFRVPPLGPAASPDEIARDLLAPARAQIDRASRLRLLLPGGLAQVDVHALPWNGAPLMARLPVEYGLDLAPAPDVATGEPHALVVGDPRRDLPEARGEAHAVVDALTSARSSPGAVAVTLLEEGAATHAAVVDGLTSASLFHYAGHATYEGEDGWDSTLPLAANGRLLVSDVLALRHAPAQVVLSGCSAAHSASASPGDTLGIAQAFLVAGSEVVVAPTRAVSDALSARFARALYEALRTTPDLVRATRDAQLHLREQDPTSDWANFRALHR